jgi:hypothetical protein
MSLNIISTEAVLNDVPINEIIRYLSGKNYIVITKDLHQNFHEAVITKEINCKKTAERAKRQRDEVKAQKIAAGTYKKPGRPRKYPLMTPEVVSEPTRSTNPNVLVPNLPKMTFGLLPPPPYALVG